MKKALFIDRDGTIILEPPDEQIDSLEKLEFVPRAITVLARIAEEFDYELVMATNQDGLGTSSFPEDTFHPAQNKMISVLQGEGVVFDDILIDRSFSHENTTTRKPGTGMFGKYLEKGAYNLAESFVIGDRITDAKLAQNLGSQAIILHSKHTNSLTDDDRRTLPIALETQDWREVYAFLLTRQASMRLAEVQRKTNETDILIKLNLDGTGKARIHTGLGFFDHLLDQLVRHSGIDLEVTAHGDLHIDEHHTIEDTALALGETFTKALGDKRGITRYGYYLLPMDEALAEASVEFIEQISEHSSKHSSKHSSEHSAEQFSETRTHAAIDFSGRNWLVWKAEFKREKIGDVPTEMFHHFFKSFTDTAKCTLNLHSVADNEHHKIEALFKAFARAVKVAIRRDARNNAIPSTKGVL